MLVAAACGSPEPSQGIRYGSPAPAIVGTTLDGGSQAITGGPVASQEVIKELGTNGGGFYNANSAHPFENPTALTNIFEIFLIQIGRAHV